VKGEILDSKRKCSHFANAFIDIGAGWESRYLLGGQFKHANLALLDSYLRANNANLLLGLKCLVLNLLDELGRI
jgi:hypothetical protein